MMGRVFRRIALALACTLVSTTAFGAWMSPCATARLIASWKYLSAWRTLAIYDPPKSPYGHQVRYVGPLHAGSRSYRIYFDDSSAPEGSHHRHQDIVVLTSTGKFLGSYDAGDVPLPITIRGPDILFNFRKEDGDRIHFGPAGPPKEVRLDGELPDFQTPEGFRKDAPNEKPWPPRGPQVRAYCRP